ncbi:MAG: hypothetical protein SFU83_03590 [Meiothermus sp.]|nr:hypothetical protein [Meiothermus sp.]
MNERNRIEALFQSGKITREEADLLISALEEGSKAEDYAYKAMDENLGQPQVSHQPAGWQPDGLPQNLRWIRLRLLAGELEVKLDPSLQSPVVAEGQAEVRPSGGDVEIIPQMVKSSFLGGLLSGMPVGSLEIRVPPGWGLDLDSKAGNVEVDGIDYLRGRIAAGNVELERVKGLDLETSAGNIEGTLLLTEGRHRLKVSMGNVDLDLLEGSSVRLDAGVSMGNLAMNGNFQPGTSIVGGGSASFDLAVRMGNLEVRAK